MTLKRAVMTEARCYILALKVEEGGQEPRNVNQAALETGKGQAVDVPPEPPEGAQPFGQRTLTLDF